MLLITSSLIIVFPIKAMKLSGNTLYVGGSGPGNYSIIDAAMEDASNEYGVFH